MAALLAAHPRRLDGDEMRKWFDERGVQFGPAFAGLAAAHIADGTVGTVLAEVGLPGPIRSQQSALRRAPRAAGCLLPVGCGPSRVPRSQVSGGLLLPLGVRRLRAYAPARNARYCYTHGDQCRRGRGRGRPRCARRARHVLLAVRGCRFGTGVSESADRDRVLGERLLTIEWQQRDAARRGARRAAGTGC